MAREFEIRFDTSDALRRLEDAGGRAVRDGAEHLLEQANRTIPIEEGTMARSGQVTSEGTTAAVSYDTPYAVRQHEDTRLRHDPGRRAKWLERTARERSEAIGTMIAGVLRRALR